MSVRKRRLLLVAPLLSVLGCVKYLPPTIAPAPNTFQIAGPVAQTWDAVVEFFAVQLIPVRTIERASGYVAAERLGIASSRDESFARSLADCGVLLGEGGRRIEYYPSSALFNVLVRGDSLTSSVRVTIDFVSWENPQTEMRRRPCVSKGRYESMIAEYVRERVQK